MHGVRVFGFFMMYQVWEEDGRLCVETPQEVDNSLAFLRKMHAQKLVDYMSWTFATTYPGSDLNRVAQKYNLVVPRYQDKQVGYELDRSMNLPGISSRKLFVSRAKGLLLQASFAVTAGGYLGRRSFRTNVRKAIRKLRYLVWPR